jgi:lysophospholipase L1-like esterase
MATDQKISQLTENPSITGTEEIPTERGGSNYKNTFNSLKTFFGISGTNTGDETTGTIQSKRPLKTVGGETLEGTGDIPTPDADEIEDSTTVNKFVNQQQLDKLGLLGYPLVSGGSILNMLSSGSDRGVTTTPIPSNTGEELILETRFYTNAATSYDINIEGANGLLIGKFGNDLICGFNGGGYFTLSSASDFKTNVNGTDLKMIYTRSTGAIQVFCNGNKIELDSDIVTPVTSFFGGNLSVGSRYSPANNFTNGFVNYLRMSVDGVPIVDYSFDEGSGSTVVDSIGGYDLTLEGSSYSWSDVNIKRDNALNIGFIGDSNCVGRATAEEVNAANPLLPLDGNIDSGAYWDGKSFEQFTLDMNLGGDVLTGRYGSEYTITELIKTNLGKNTNIIKYALGGSQCTDGGEWNSVNGTLTKDFINEVNSSRIELDAIVVFLGENSATNPTDSGNYEAQQKLLIERLRNDIKNGINIPIILVRLYDFTAANIIAEVPTIQAAHDSIELTKRNVVLVKPQNITGVKSDDAHFNGFGINSLGLELFKGIKRVV